MTRTSLRFIAVLVFLSAVAAFFLEWVLVRWGEPMVVPPLTLTVTFLVLAVSIPALAWPVRAVTRPRKGRPPARVDPFYATRVVLLAKATAVASSVFAGAGLGVLGSVFSRPVVVWTSVWWSGALVVASVAALVGSLVAERWCELPPSSEGSDAPGTAKGEPA